MIIGIIEWILIFVAAGILITKDIRAGAVFGIIMLVMFFGMLWILANYPVGLI